MVLTRSMTKNMTKKQPIKSPLTLFTKPKVNLKEEFIKLRTQELSIQRRKKRSTNPDSPNQIQHSKPLEYNKLFIRYLGDIEQITGIPISPRQKELIKKAIESNKFVRLNKEEHIAHRKTYNQKRNEMIENWEKNTGREWTKYDKPVYSNKGKIVRNVGDRYDCHEIILNSWGSPLEWWNGIPARYPEQHQNGVHRKGGYADKIFNQNG